MLVFSFQNYWFSSMYWNYDGPEMPGGAISLDMFRYPKSYLFNSNCFIFADCVNCYVFTWGTLFVSTNHGVFSNTSGLESWLTRSGKSAIRIEISLYPNPSFLKTADLNCSIDSTDITVWIDGLKWRWYSFQCFLDGTVSNSVSQIGLLIGWTSEHAKKFI